MNDLHHAIIQNLADLERHAADVRATLETCDAPTLTLAEALVEVADLAEWMAGVADRLEPYGDTGQVTESVR